jgi:hypothetical protein
MEHLQKAGTLDLKAIDVQVTDVKYEGNKATAQVSFKPKTSPDKGMSMAYTLERRGTKWQVMGKAAGHGGGMGMGAAPPTETPSGHPPVTPPKPGEKPSELPAGHPPVNQPAPPTK